MGQKVHPYSLRLGINKPWKSRWYVNPKDYARVLHEDIKIRRVILQLPEAKAADVSDIEIVRHPQKVSVTIHTSHPGVFIGAKGINIEKIGNDIFNKLGIRCVLRVKEIKRAEADAQCVALSVAKQLKGRSSFRRILKMAISGAVKAGVQGIKVKVSGRLGGAEMARSVEMKEGRVPLQTLRADIDYGFAEVNTTYGILGVKVWICKGEVLRKEKREESFREEPHEAGGREKALPSSEPKVKSIKKYVRISKEAKKELETGVESSSQESVVAVKKSSSKKRDIIQADPSEEGGSELKKASRKKAVKEAGDAKS